MAAHSHGRARTTSVANDRDEGARRRDLEPSDARRAAGLPARPLHAGRARGDEPPLGGGAGARPRPAVPRGRGEDRGVDDDGDPGRPVAAPRPGRLPRGARPTPERQDGRLRIAVPAKGRLREPAVSLLEDAGLGPEEPGERALAFPCRNAPVDVLLVRAADIPEYVQDGVVDCGITGQDLVAERGARVDELLPLGFGSCRLDAAVPEESGYRRIEDL